MSEDPIDPRILERLTRAVGAAQALSETLWDALQEELVQPRSWRVAELSEQIGALAATIASLAQLETRARTTPAPQDEHKAREASVAENESTPPDEAPFSELARPARGETPFSESARPAHGEAPFSEHSPAPPQAPSEPPPSSAAMLVDELAPIAPERRAQARPRIEIRDQRGEEGPAAWIGSIGRRLERYERDGAPFAVLLVELTDIERLREAESPEELTRLTAQMEEALARELRPADSLTCERPGRYWLLAPQTDWAAAQMLAERIARAVRAAASHRGTPLEAAVGIAVCPEDGRHASQLAAHADVALYAARAAGRTQ